MDMKNIYPHMIFFLFLCDFLLHIYKLLLVKLKNLDFVCHKHFKDRYIF